MNRRDPLAEVLAQFSGERARVVDQALRSLTSHAHDAHVLMCELVAEVKAEGHWRAMRDERGVAYRSWRHYLCDVTGFKKTYAVYMAKIGALLRALPLDVRLGIRAQLAAMSFQKRHLVAVMVQERAVPLERALSRAANMGGPSLRDELMTVKAGARTHPQRHFFVRHLAALGAPPHLIDEVYDVARKKLNSQDAKEITARILTDWLAHHREWNRRPGPPSLTTTPPHPATVPSPDSR